jgi:hypothetical protein
MRIREEVWWRGVAQHGMMRTAVAMEGEGKIYRRAMLLSYDFGRRRLGCEVQPVPKATLVSFYFNMIQFSI